MTDLITLNVSSDNNKCSAMFNGDKNTEFSISRFTASVNRNTLSNPELLELFNSFCYKMGINQKLQLIYEQADISFRGLVTENDVKYYIKELLSFMDITLIQEHIINAGMKYPENLKETFNEENEKNVIETRNQTYLRHEYIELMSLVIACKVLIPIINRVSVTYNTEAMFMLLRRAYPEFLDIVPIVRLRRFVESHITQTSGSEDNKIYTSTMVDNVGSTELADYVLGRLLFKVFPIFITTKAPPKHSNIIGTMFYIVANMFTGTKKVDDIYTPKGPSSDDSGDDGSQSMFESYRQSTLYSPGKIEVIRKPYRDINRLASDIGIKDIRIVNKVLKDISPLLNTTKLLHSFTVNLLKISMAIRVDGIPYDSPMSYELLERSQIVNMLAVFAAYAIESGFGDMAKFYTLYEEEIDELKNIGGDIKAKGKLLKPERVDSINRDTIAILKHEYRVYLKRKDGDNISVDAINNMTKTLNVGYFKYLIRKEFLDCESDVMRPTKELRERLAGYILYIKREHGKSIS